MHNCWCCFFLSDIWYIVDHVNKHDAFAFFHVQYAKCQAKWIPMDLHLRVRILEKVVKKDIHILHLNDSTREKKQPWCATTATFASIWVLFSQKANMNNCFFFTSYFDNAWYVTLSQHHVSESERTNFKIPGIIKFKCTEIKNVKKADISLCFFSFNLLTRRSHRNNQKRQFNWDTLWFFFQVGTWRECATHCVSDVCL